MDTTANTARNQIEDLGGCGETILVIEDDPALQLFLRQVFDSFNYRTLIAGSVLDGIMLWHENRNEISAIVSDFFLPDGTGELVVKIIHGHHAEAKIMIFTGSAENERVRQLSTKVPVLAKPANIYEIAACLKGLLQA